MKRSWNMVTDNAEEGPLVLAVNGTRIGRRRSAEVLVILAGALLASACDDSALDPEDQNEQAGLFFEADSVHLSDAGTASVTIRNGRSVSVGPITLQAGPVENGAGAVASDANVRVEPGTLSSLSSGAGAELQLALEASANLPSGDYHTTLEARLSSGIETTVPIGFSRTEPESSDDLSISIVGAPAEIRQGDVVTLVAEVVDQDQQPVSVAVTWSLAPLGAGVISSQGDLVGYQSGGLEVVATSGAAADTVGLTVTARDLPPVQLEMVSNVSVTARYTSDLWIFGDHGYTGTWGQRIQPGNAMFVWDVSDPQSPTMVDSVIVDARTVNDVKVSADGAFAVLTHEGSSDNLNGITIVDLSDPASPRVVTRYTDGLETGVHNVWIEDDYVYVAVDGGGNGLRILDVSDLTDPVEVADFYAGESILHDVYVRAGLAFLSHWNAGLVILDVGYGIVGGTPSTPVEVSRLRDLGGETHNAWYWPEAGYVFVGEEQGAPGRVHVVDVSDLRNPREVAVFRKPGISPHNFWLDEGRAILYMAWYDDGLRALDVSGRLMGELQLQGREVAWLDYRSGSGCPGTSASCAWAPQLHRGDVYLSDMNTGLWVFRPSF